MDFITGVLSALLVALLIGIGMWYFGTVYPFRKYDDPKSNWRAIEKALNNKENSRG